MSKRKQYPSQARLRELFDYDPEGFLVWKYRPEMSKSWNSRWAGSVAGSFYIDGSGSYHSKVTIDKKVYSARDITWIYFKGAIPEGMKVTNKDSNRHNSSIGNLEITGKSKNAGIIKKTTGMIGVRRRSDDSFSCECLGLFVGCYATAIDAATAYDNAREEVDGVRPNLTIKREPTRLSKRFNRGRGGDCKGVEIVPSERYRSRIGRKHLGTFDTKEQAARAYNIAAYEHYGEHAVLNDIPDPLGKGDIF